MVFVGMILGYMLFGMIPRLLSGKIRTTKKIYILLTINAIIAIPVILASKKADVTISIIVALTFLYFIFKKELKGNTDQEENGYMDCKGKYHTGKTE